ncbi:hypothetical protein FKW77_004459 [Venturia effusa]|uniref:PA14 domain-containing protein n=1 Tax=Venturia effusa TaxID=50376 RepID=A0A517LH14_9PEZI|nr:hypothetical protein FKW77_004459 [Venturia effusa]
MKVTFVIPFLAQGIVAGIVQRQQSSCTDDDCALAVNPLDTRLNSIAREDCSSYLQTTLTVGVTTTTETSTSTFWTITETQCNPTSPALRKRAYGPYYSANATSTVPSATGTGMSLGTSASPVTTFPSTTTDISQQYTIPPYATPCGIPYYYSSACACVSIFETYVYETVPVITSIAIEGTVEYTTVGCTPTDTASLSSVTSTSESSLTSEVSSMNSVPTDSSSTLSSSSTSTSRPNITVPGPPPSSSSSSSITLSIFTVRPPTGPFPSSAVSTSPPPFPMDNSTTIVGPTIGPTGTAPAVTAPIGTGSSSIVTLPFPPFPMDNSTTTSGPTEGPTAITPWITGVTLSQPSSSAPFPMDNATSSIVGPSGTAPLVTAPIGTGIPSVPTDVPYSSPPYVMTPPYAMSNDTFSTGPTAGSTGTAPLVTGVPETSSPAPPYPMTNETSPLGPTAGPTGTGSIGTGVTSIPYSSSPPYPMDNTTAIAGPTGTGSVGSSIPPGIETSLPPYPMDNSTSFPGPTGTGSIGTNTPTNIPTISPPFPLTNTTSCSDAVGPTGTGNTIPLPSSTLSSNTTDSMSIPTSSFGSTGTGGAIVTGTGSSASPATETGLFPNSTLGSPVQATESSSSLVGTISIPLATGMLPTGTAPVGLPSPTNECVPSVHNTTMPDVDNGYQPNYAADYTGCFLDPESTQAFNLVENGSSTPIVNVNGYAKRMPDSSSFQNAYFTFEKPSSALVGRQCGVYDLAYHDGDTKSYIAVFNDGVVAFVPTSSNGQDTADLTNQYVTSIWSIDCTGTLSAGITNELAFEFSFIQTPNRGTLMVVNWDFDGDLGTAGGVGNGGTGGAGNEGTGGVGNGGIGGVGNGGTGGVGGSGVQKRKVQGQSVGTIRLSLARLSSVAPREVGGKTGKRGVVRRGPKPRSDRVLNL